MMQHEVAPHRPRVTRQTTAWGSPRRRRKLENMDNYTEGRIRRAAQRGGAQIFAVIAGDRGLPLQRVRELWAICARRTGKSRMAAATGCYLACFLPRNLAPGETGEVTIISATTAQAVVVYRYVLGFLQSSPILCQEIESVTQSEVRLKGNVVLSVRSGNYRTVRGRTLLAAIIDEVAFLRDETSSMPDVETYRALLPALATTGGMLIGISTPYRRIGLLFQKHRDYYGVTDPDVLVVAGDCKTFNPTLDQSIIERARASDPEGCPGRMGR